MTARQEKKFGAFRKKYPGPERTEDFYRDAYEACFDPETNKVDFENMALLLDSYDDPELSAECLAWVNNFNADRDEMMRSASALRSKEQNRKSEAAKTEETNSDEGKKELDLHLDRLSDCKEKETEWLFPMMMPVGDITILAGDGGTGKTLV